MGMAPVEIAAKLCADRGGDFRDEMEAFLLGGVVIATPELFLMAKAVPKGVEMQSAWDTWPAHKATGWMVWSGVGKPWRLIQQMPYELDWIGWVRQGRGWSETHWVETAKIRARFASKETGVLPPG